jgi:hypothetical protein
VYAERANGIEMIKMYFRRLFMLIPAYSTCIIM